MQNYFFEFIFSDKSKIDEKTFFLWFQPHLIKPEEKPKPRNPVMEGAMAAMMGKECPPSGQEEYSPAPDIFYAANYDHTNERLTVNVVTEFNDPKAKPGTLHIHSSEGVTSTVINGLDGAIRYQPLADDAWEVFYQHATFDEILKSIDTDGGDSVLVKMHKFDSCTEDAEKAKLALQIIRDCPAMLLGEKFAVELINILEKARWDTGKAESEKALNLLKDHLMPMRPGGKIPLPPNIQAVKAVMEALAKHLSEKCKSAIDDTLRTCLDRGGEIDEDLYHELTEWAQMNREFRISRLPRKELDALILKPKAYVNDLLKTHFRSSIKTMRRNNA